MTNISESVKLDAVIESIGEGIVVTDQQGRLTMMNPQAEKMLQLPFDKVKDKFYFEVMFPENQYGELLEMDDRPMTQTLKTQKKVEGKVRFRFPDGKYIYTSVTTTPYMIKGKLAGVVLAFRDISKEENIEMAKSEFVSLASHQLRTPLSAIRWYAEMMMSGDAGELTEPQKKLLKEIYRGTKRMVELISALLDVSRIEVGTFAVQPEDTDVAAISASCISELSPAILEKGLQIMQQYDAGVPHIYMDPKHMRIILQNLLTNAAKYTPTGGKISVRMSKGEGDTITITVADTGYGIPKESQDRIFSKLYRAENIKARDTDGTGLGLYLVKSIVEHNGGKITFQSEENKGTEFVVTMPLRTKAKLRSGGEISSLESQTVEPAAK